MNDKKQKIHSVVELTEKEARKYELMILITPSITEKKRNEAYQEVLSLIAENQGEVVSEYDLGKRELAYNIRGNDEAFYAIIYFKTSNSDLPKVLERYFRFSHEVIRSMMVKRDDSYTHFDVTTEYDKDKETERREKVLKSPIDYKNITLLRNYVSRYARIVPRYYTKVSLKQQKMLSQEVKRARQVALMPFVS